MISMRQALLDEIVEWYCFLVALSLYLLSKEKEGWPAQ